MAVGRKLTHVRPDLEAMIVSASLRFTPGWCRGARPYLRKGCIPQLYLDAKLRDSFVEVVDVGQYLAHHEGVMRGEASFQSIRERGQLRA
jgi:hypothetical protein